MNIQRHSVIFTTIAVCILVGCEKPEKKEPGPLERASTEDRVLASSIPKPEPSHRSEPAKTIELAQPVEIVLDNNEEANGTTDAPGLDDLKPSFEPSIEPSDGLVIQRLLTAPDVEAREPVAESSVFGHHEEKVYAFLELSNATEEDDVITVYFIGPSGQVTGGVELDVPAKSPRWRTWAFTRAAREIGAWRVEVRSKSGALLATLPFEIAPGC